MAKRLQLQLNRRGVGNTVGVQGNVYSFAFGFALRKTDDKGGVSSSWDCQHKC